MALFPTGGDSDKRPESVNSPSQVQSFVFLELMELIQRPWSLTAILSRFHGQKTDSRTGPEQVQDGQDPGCPKYISNIRPVISVGCLFNILVNKCVTKFTRSPKLWWFIREDLDWLKEEKRREVITFVRLIKVHTKILSRTWVPSLSICPKHSPWLNSWVSLQGKR